jgi:predicted DsbA family dithiol-disulfide isomerase
VELVWRHFPLHPDVPAEGMRLDVMFAGRPGFRAAQARLHALLSAEGLPTGQGDMTFNTRDAQELASWAATQPGGELLHRALFEAVHARSLNIADHVVLARLLAEVGLDAEAGLAAVRARTFATAVDADWQEARDLGITGVPTFVSGRLGVVGAQPYETLVELVTRAGGAKKS